MTKNIASDQLSAPLTRAGPVNTIPPPDTDDGNLDITALFLTLWRGKWIIAICALMLGTIAFLFVSRVEPTYRASAKVMFDIQQSNIIDLQEVLTEQTYDSGKLEDEIQVLRSSSLIARVVDSSNLVSIPEFNPTLRTPPPSLGDRLRNVVTLPPEIADLLTKFGLYAAPEETSPVGAAVTEERIRRNAIKKVLQGIRLTPIGRSRVIEISFISNSPTTAAAIVNNIAEQYIVDQLEAKLEATRAATSWLSSRVQELQLGLQAAEENVEAARSAINDVTGQSVDVTNQQLESLNASLAETRAEVSRQQTKYDRLQAALDQKRDIGAISEFRQSRLIQQYRVRLGELNAQRTTLAQSVRDNHPALVRLDQQIEDFENNLSSEAGRIVDATVNDLKSAKDQEASLTEEVRRLEQQLLVQSKEQVKLRQLEREAQARRVLYESFLGRMQETSEQVDLQEADARVLTPAEPPLYAEAQAKRSTILAGLILGSLLGAGIVFLLEKLNNTFRSPNQLADHTGEKLLGVIPQLRARSNRSAIVSSLKDKPNSPLAEAIRNLRTSILFSNVDNPPKVIMFTSSLPFEGKSTSSLLVAITSRQMGKSAIVVDCDLRLPVVAKALRLKDKERGLMPLFEGTCTLDEAISEDPDTGLHVLAGGSSDENSKINAADLLSSNLFENIIDQLRERYDIVILDTPPTLLLSDARLVSRLADAVVYTVRWQKTPRGAVKEGLHQLRSVGANVAGVVMTVANEAKMRRNRYEGYQYYKGNHKQYYQ